MVKKIPLLLIYYRLLIAFVFIALALFYPSFSTAAIILLITTGLLSDIFDGIIARRLHCSTESLRRLDSTIDQVFWCALAFLSFARSPEFFYKNWLALLVLILTELTTYIISYARFQKEVATHAIASKVWALVLFATLMELIVYGDSGWLFQVCIYLGIVTRMEIIAILLLVRQWTADVPSVYHAFRLRQGKAIKRNKLFNG